MGIIANNVKELYCDKCNFARQYADDQHDQYVADMTKWSGKCPECGDSN